MFAQLRMSKRALGLLTVVLLMPAAGLADGFRNLPEGTAVIGTFSENLLFAADNLVARKSKRMIHSSVGSSLLEGEDATGDGFRQPRGNASRGATRRVTRAPAQMSWTFRVDKEIWVDVSLRYSNDGYSDTLLVKLDGIALGKVNTMSTGNGGFGWNVFALGSVATGLKLSAGLHTASVNIMSCDEYGVEVDILRFDARGPPAPVPRITVAPTRREVSCTGGGALFDVASAGEGIAHWRANETSTWMRITKGIAGTNSGPIRVVCTPNRARSVRTGRIAVQVMGAAGTKHVVVLQGGRVRPLLSVVPESREFGSTGGRTAFAVSNKGGGQLNWRASETSSWLRIVSGQGGVGRGTVVVLCSSNLNAVPRSALIRIAAAGANGTPRFVQIRQTANRSGP